jgi:hypothetical protein
VVKVVDEVNRVDSRQGKAVDRKWWAEGSQKSEHTKRG